MARPDDTAAPSGRRERNPIASLARVLGALVDSPATGLGVRELARSLSTPASSVQRTLDAAGVSGLVAQDASGSWHLGWEFFRLSALGQRHHPFAEARPILERLRDDTGETAVLTVYDRFRGERMFVDSVASKFSIRFVPDVLAWLPMHAGASSHAILAFRPDDEKQAVIERGLSALTARTPHTVSELEGTHQRVRTRGYAVSDDEVNLGAVGVAAPIWVGGEVTSSIGVILPRQRFHPDLESGLTEQVIAAARDLQERVAARPS